MTVADCNSHCLYYLGRTTAMQIFSIYKATNKINGKSYIGHDSNWPNRYNHHKHKSKKSGKYHFQRALYKHGFENFDWEVICQSLDGEYLLNVMEPYFIEQYDTFNNGYNMTKGGEGLLGKQFSKETREKLRQARFKQPPRSKETREKISKSTVGKRKGEKNAFFGKKHTEETKLKMRQSRLAYLQSIDATTLDLQVSIRQLH